MRDCETAARCGERQHFDAEVPIFRNLMEGIRTHMPKEGRSKVRELDPWKFHKSCITALEVLDGNYKNAFEAWAQSDIRVPPCFIVACNNTSTLKRVYDYISGLGGYLRYVAHTRQLGN